MDPELDSGEDAFTADEQAAFDAMAAGDEGSSGAPEIEADGAPDTGGAPEKSADEIAAETAAAEAAAKDEADKAARQTVDKGALDSERNKRKDAEKRERALGEQLAVLGERLRILTEASGLGGKPAGAEKPAAAKMPDPKEDIFGAFEHVLNELNALKSGHQATVEQTAAEKAETALVGNYQADARRFVASEPSFGGQNGAYAYLVQSRIAELAEVGVTGQDAIAAIRADERAIAEKAFAEKRSPAEVLFKLAKARGFVAKSAEPTAEEKAAAAAEATRKAGEEAAARLGNVTKGQAANKSLSGTAGTPAGEMTADQLVKMSESEFAAYAEKNPRTVERLMGGSGD